MNQPDLAALLQRFFGGHLIGQRNVSPHTVAAYRDTFRLLLRFLQRSRRIGPSPLPLEALDARNVLEFLAHLESDRGNVVRSRNARLAAIRSFVRFAADELGPALPEPVRRILAIPMKRHSKRLVGFLTRAEIEAILAAADESWTGRRDHLLFLLLYNTGARVSEIASVKARDVSGDARRIALHGKGRKERAVPLWPVTRTSLRRWIRENTILPDAPLLPNRFGEPMSRSGVTFRLKTLLRKAASQCASLDSRRVSPHILRHSTAMHMLQAGIPIEVIALWLGHENPATTHLYLEADIEMKRRTLETIRSPKSRRQHKRRANPDLLGFLDDI